MRAGHFEASASILSPEELEFFAEEELITIIPKISTTETDDTGRAGHLVLLSGAPRCRVLLRPVFFGGTT
jgi:hypothetical protein